MSVRIIYKKWCPRGCGKKVTFLFTKQTINNNVSVYRCNKCGELYLKNQLLDLNPHMNKYIRDKNKRLKKDDK